MLRQYRKVQPFDVCINKIYPKGILGRWEDHVVKVVKDVGDEANNDPSFQLNSPIRQDIVSWVYQDMFS